MFEEDIRNFNKQFSWEPVLENSSALGRWEKAAVLGMGGSHLGADLFKAYDPSFDLSVYSNYGLPLYISGGHLIIASSYSGNTEEVLDGLNQALEKDFLVAVMASGGRLIEIAKEKKLPYIQLPSGLQPRMSIGLQVKALAKLLGRQDILKEVRVLAERLNPSEFEEKGKTLAEKLKSRIPVIYSSEINRVIAYAWKAKFHETAKVPAFFNVFPEMNHNEMTGFASQDQTFSFIVLADQEDHPRIKRRMEVFTDLFNERGLSVETVKLVGEGRLFRLFSSLILADWVSYYLAKQKDVDPEQIPLVEKFKKLII